MFQGPPIDWDDDKEPFVPVNSRQHIVCYTRDKFKIDNSNEFTELYIPEMELNDKNSI